MRWRIRATNMAENSSNQPFDWSQFLYFSEESGDGSMPPVDAGGQSEAPALIFGNNQVRDVNDQVSGMMTNMNM